MAGGGLLSNMAPRPGDGAEDERRQRAAAAQAMGDGGGAEVSFAGEVPLESQVYWWHDKYRPRKPKYFNRVHTGYEWNKYNQTHYDHDNPPPKVVQGYKFNIFYPDLIDKTVAPRYEVLPDGAGASRRLLVFQGQKPLWEEPCGRLFVSLLVGGNSAVVTVRAPLRRCLPSERRVTARGNVHPAIHRRSAL